MLQSLSHALTSKYANLWCERFMEVLVKNETNGKISSWLKMGYCQSSKPDSCFNVNVVEMEQDSFWGVVILNPLSVFVNIGEQKGKHF